MSAHEPQPLVRTAFKLEREIQRRLEADLSEVFGIRIPLTVFPNGDTRPGRIDSMGIALAQLSPRPSLPLRRHAHSLGQNLARGPRGATPRDQRDVHDSLHAVKPVSGGLPQCAGSESRRSISVPHSMWIRVRFGKRGVRTIRVRSLRGRER